MVNTSLGHCIDDLLEKEKLHQFIYCILLIFIIPHLKSLQKLLLAIVLQASVVLFLNNVAIVSFFILPVGYYLDKKTLKHYGRHVIIAFGSDVFLTKVFYPNDKYSDITKFDVYFTIGIFAMIFLTIFAKFGQPILEFDLF